MSNKCEIFYGIRIDDGSMTFKMEGEMQAVARAFRFLEYDFHKNFPDYKGDWINEQTEIEKPVALIKFESDDWGDCESLVDSGDAINAACALKYINSKFFEIYADDIKKFNEENDKSEDSEAK